MAALSPRFCPLELFVGFLPPKEDGSQRESWEVSKPFLDQAKALTMSAVDLPSAEVVGGLIMLAFVDFGDNNEAGTRLDISGTVATTVSSNPRFS